MNKIALTPAIFNSLQRDPNGPKSQRSWIPELRGLGIDLGRTKKSFIYKFKSPVTSKYRIAVLESYTYSQKVDKSDILDIEEDYLSMRKQIRSGIDPLLEKDEARKARKQAILAKKIEHVKKVESDGKQAYTLNRAFDAYTRNRLFTLDISETTQTRYLQCYKQYIRPVLGHIMSTLF